MNKSNSATKTKQPKKTPTPAVWVPPAATRALMLRTCDEGMKAHGGFIWPRSGYVEAPDWSPTKKCGNGLHGLLWGAGKANLLNAAAVDWLVVEIDSTEAIDLVGKVKVPRCNVVFVGSRVDAVTMIQAQAPAGTPIVYGTATAGDAGTATAGARGTATAGDEGTATAGDEGTATAGYAGTATAGDAGTATAGDAGTATAGARGTATAGTRGTATAGYAGTATAGDEGTATAGDAGTATAGYAGTATAGDAGTATAGYAGTATAGARGTATAGTRGTATAGTRGTATAGYAGTATAGDEGTATAGLYGVIAIEWFDGKDYRRAIAEVDGSAIKADTAYKVVGGKFVEVCP